MNHATTLDEVLALRSENARLRGVVVVAERICQKLEHPTASVTIIDQTDLRATLNALQQTGDRK